MAIVSQLCISFPFVLHGLCEDYLTCDIALNAVMPLSRASTHGRYSRIEGVTLLKKFHQIFLFPGRNEKDYEDTDEDPTMKKINKHAMTKFSDALGAWKN